MINESSLNDVFKFVELKSANILSTFPLIETPEIKDVKDESLEIKRKKAEEFLVGLNFSIDSLKLGKLILGELSKLIEVDQNSGSYNNVPSSPKVSHFYEVAISNYIDVESEIFIRDLNILSDLVYFTGYSEQKILSKKNRILYLAYQALLKAHTNNFFKETLLRGLFGITNNSLIRDVGKAHLLVVKQHLLRYEEVDVAHIENVMKGETRSYEHRYLDRFEEALTFENEKTVETEKEQENKERFELNREASKTIKEDHKFSADLSVSGKFGPAVDFSSNVGYEYGSETESEISTSSEYAKDIMDRSLERVNERVREERITKILKENETKNLHSFTNTSSEGGISVDPTHFSGVYQFVDKVYRAQVFDYGLRQMFDLMIPEPSSYLWHFNRESDTSAEFNRNKPTFDINPFLIEYSELTRELHYTNLANTYGATGIEPPPSTRVVTFSYQQPKSEESTSGGSQWAPEDKGPTGGWQFYPPAILDIDIPQKYQPNKIEIHIQAFSDNRNKKHLNFSFNFGAKIQRLYKSPYNTDAENGIPFKYIMGGNIGDDPARGENFLFECADSFEIAAADRFDILDEEEKLKISYSSQDSANHTISIAITCEPSEELIQQWQLKTYDMLNAAYQDQLLDYESQLAQFNADRKAAENLSQDAYGIPPSKQKQVMMTELKKHAITILTDNATSKAPYNQNYSVNTHTTPPTINSLKAKHQGEFIRFFEHAFEWSQMQYAFYPYFWSDFGRWQDKFEFDDPNYEYQQFMQASSSRVVLPVRLGFEDAVAHYLHTGTIWNGETPPQIDDPLYFSIIDEIKDRAGHSDKPPIPYGKSWEVRVPTSLVKLRVDDALPKWREKDGEVWEWEVGSEEV